MCIWGGGGALVCIRRVQVLIGENVKVGTHRKVLKVWVDVEAVDKKTRLTMKGKKEMEIWKHRERRGRRRKEKEGLAKQNGKSDGWTVNQRRQIGG